MNEINVAVLVYPGVEIIDMNGPVDVFIKANRQTKKKYNVFTVAEFDSDIESEGSAVKIKPKYLLNNCPRPNIIVIPGQIMALDSEGAFGNGSEKLITWIKEKGQNADTVILCVCVGICILANTGLLMGKKATTHYQALNRMQILYPNIEFVKNVRFIPDGNIITTGGVTSGIDGALYLVETIDGREVADNIANIMVYDRHAPLPTNTIIV